jgi:hypothetical protein
MSKRTLIENRQFDEERALYHLTNAIVRGCTFAGAADGESAMKEASDLAVESCHFALRYPFWHTRRFTLADSTMAETCRAPIWYAEDGSVTGCTIHGVKALRECDRMSIASSTVVSTELGWNCRDLTITDCQMTSEYFLMGTKGGLLHHLTLHGKYSFQYTEDLLITDSELNTKDAFWHSKHVTVKNCTIRGEYLGWYSEGLTLIDCKLIGTQPLCYCKNLTLVNCTMEETDLAFEYSEVDADVHSTILSVKNPRRGQIVADGFGEIISEGAVVPCSCALIVRGVQK